MEMVQGEFGIKLDRPVNRLEGFSMEPLREPREREVPVECAPGGVELERLLKQCDTFLVASRIKGAHGDKCEGPDVVGRYFKDPPIDGFSISQSPSRNQRIRARVESGNLVREFGLREILGSPGLVRCSGVTSHGTYPFTPDRWVPVSHALVRIGPHSASDQVIASMNIVCDIDCFSIFWLVSGILCDPRDGWLRPARVSAPRVVSASGCRGEGESDSGPSQPASRFPLKLASFSRW